MKNFLAILGMGVLATAFPAYAEEKPVVEAQVEREDHYKGEQFETSVKALEGLKAKSAEIGEILKKQGEIELTEMESIHEKTYTLETAVDKMKADGAVDIAKLDAIDEAIQALHFASENQEQEKVREWYKKLEQTSGEIVLADASSLQATEPAAAPAEQKDFYEIVIKDHKFAPAELRVPADQKIKLIVDNQDATPEEFESHDFNREKIIAANTKATIFIGPLKPGTYKYFGEFNMDTAQGVIIVE